MILNKAVFINLDGCLVNTKSKQDNPINENDWEFNGMLLPKLKTLVDKGYIPIIVSNQGGIGTGKVAESEVLNRIRSIEKELEQYLGTSVSSSYATHLENYYRKPYPGMAYYFALEFKLTLRDSIMIGSSKTDNMFAKNAYIGTYYEVSDLVNITNL